MTTPITKEQLQRIIESADDVLSAQAGTNEDVHPESDDMIRLWDYLNDVAAPPAVVKRLAEMALAAMDAEPVAWMVHARTGDQLTTDGDYVANAEGILGLHSTPLYAIPPAPVVNAEPVADVVAWHKEGEERTCDIRWRRFDVAPGPLFAVAQPVMKDHQIRELVNELRDIAVEYHGTQQLRERIARKVRAAMLNHSENERDMVERVSQPYKLPATRFQQVADLYGITSPTGSETSFTFDAFEASSFAKSGWAVQEYVELERYQEAVAGNSPVIPDGYVLVPKIVTPEISKAINEVGNRCTCGNCSQRLWDLLLVAAPQQE